MSLLNLAEMLCLAVIIGSCFACTDTQYAAFNALGSQHHIQCWSGDSVIYEGNSTGRVLSPDGSDGWRFEDAETRKLVEVSGNCVITIL